MSKVEFTETVTQFINRLEALDSGDRARLKRNAGRKLAESRDVLGLFYSLLPYGVSPHQEEIFFLVATLFPIAQKGGAGDLGAALRRAQLASNKKGLDRRVEILLDSDLAQLPFRLRQAIHFLQSNRVCINWPSLLQDLLYWSHPERFVQQRWARTYFVD